MFRTTAARAAPRALRTLNVAATRNTLVSGVLRASLKTSATPLTSSGPLSLALREPLKRSVVRYQSGTAYQQASFVKGLSKEAEEAYGNEKLVPVPEEVSVDSSVHPITGEVGKDAEAEENVDMMAGIRNDFVSHS